MTFNTGLPVPSTDPRNLYDNAENLDNLINGADPFYADRLGKLRESWAGMENSFTNAQDGRETAFTLSQADKESRFQAFLVSSGYVSKGDYAANVVLAERNEYVTVSAATTGASAGFYRPNEGAALPLTLSGDWAADEPLLRLMGSDVLRQEIADGDFVTAEMVGYKGTTIAATLDAGLPIKIFDAEPATPPQFVPFMVILPPDVDAPVMTAFVVTSGVASPLPITQLSATDNRGVTGWLISEEATAPLGSDPRWRSVKPSTYSTTTVGSATLYAYAKDAAGNISEPMIQAVTIAVGNFISVDWPYDPAVHQETLSVRAGGGTVINGAPTFNLAESASIVAIDMAIRGDKSGSYPGTGDLVLNVRSGGPDGAILITGVVPNFSSGSAFQAKRFSLPDTLAIAAGTTYYLELLISSPVGDTLYSLPIDSTKGSYWYQINGTAWASATGQAPLQLVKA